MIIARELSRKVLLVVVFMPMFVSCFAQFPEKFENSKLCEAIQCDLISKSESGAKDVVRYYYTTGIGEVFLTEKKGGLREASLFLTKDSPTYSEIKSETIKYAMRFIKEISDQDVVEKEFISKMSEVDIYLGEEKFFGFKSDSKFKVSIRHRLVEYDQSGTKLGVAKGQWSINVVRKLLPI
jgi:hypothetical protein